MTVTITTTAPADPVTQRRRRRLLGAGVLLTLLVLGMVASIALGSRSIPLAQVWDGLFYRYVTDGSSSNPELNDIASIIQGLRIPRTLLALIVGISLGIAGALIQGHTRNPIADPGLLGITAGAGFAVVLAIFAFNLSNPLQYVWFSFAGAAIASVLVFGLSSLGSGAASPLTLVLAGTGISIVLSALTRGIALLDEASLDALRFWDAGSVSGRGYDVILVTAPFMVVGVLLALINTPAVNMLNLGDDVARGLGLNIAGARTVGVLAITLMAGAATAACGSIAFLGLMAPHLARAFTGPDYRWLIPYAGLIGAITMLFADVAGRLVVRPGELEVGIMLALIGAPFFVALVWWRKKVTSA